MNQVAKTYIINKVTFLLKNQKYQDINDFYNQNNTFEQFISNHCNSSTIVAHFNLSISNREYNDIVSELKNILPEKIKDNNATDTNTLQKVKKININKINGFVDALILAFITGGFIGIIFLNLYSKIVSNI